MATRALIQGTTRASADNCNLSPSSNYLCGGFLNLVNRGDLINVNTRSASGFFATSNVSNDLRDTVIKYTVYRRKYSDMLFVSIICSCLAYLFCDRSAVINQMKAPGLERCRSFTPLFLKTSECRLLNKAPALEACRGYEWGMLIAWYLLGILYAFPSLPFHTPADLAVE